MSAASHTSSQAAAGYNVQILRLCITVDRAANGMPGWINAAYPVLPVFFCQYNVAVL